MRNVLIKSRGLTIAAHLYLPSGFTESEQYAAIGVLSVGEGLKQKAGAYAQRLADQGFATLVFETIGQVAAEVSGAIDYLATLAFVDKDRIGVLGVCEAAATALEAASSDYRIKAVTTVGAEGVDEGMDKLTPFFMRNL